MTSHCRSVVAGRYSAVARAFLGASVAALTLGGCALSPRDGQVIASRSTPVHYEIIVPWPDPVIRVQAARFLADGTFAFWDDEWSCSPAEGGCGATVYGPTDGSGNDDYWRVIRDEPIPTTIIQGTRHWLRTGALIPKWRTQVRAIAAPSLSGNQSTVAIFANTQAATNCIVSEFTENSGASAYVNCKNESDVANVFARAD